MMTAAQPETKASSHQALHPPPAQPGGAKPVTGPGLDPLASLRAHWVMAVLIVLAVIAIGLPVAWWKGQPKYSATAVIFVSPRFLANLEDNKEFDLQSNSQYREYVQQNVRTINRFDILEEALKRIGPLQSVWVRPKESLEHATERLQADLTVEPVTDTYQIAITLEADKKAGLAALVDSIANIYLEKAKTEELICATPPLPLPARARREPA